jgi:hypothetical protein
LLCLKLHHHLKKPPSQGTQTAALNDTYDCMLGWELAFKLHKTTSRSPGSWCLGTWWVPWGYLFAKRVSSLHPHNWQR